MAPMKTSVPIKMTSPIPPITLIKSSIYVASTVTFINDTQAYTTIDINQSKIT